MPNTSSPSFRLRDACTGVLQFRGLNIANARVALANGFVV